MTATVRGRFAPSATGRAHPGTWLAALLCWLDTRQQGGTVALRLEDLDPQRCRPELTKAIRDDLDWLGLTWDVVSEQHDAHERHAAALDQLAAAGRLYPCDCSRRALRELGRVGPDGGLAYDNRNRGVRLPPGGWRAVSTTVRVNLGDEPIHLIDEGGTDCSLNPGLDLGDPVVVRRDGAIAYHLAAVVDDAAASVTRVVRGRDLVTSTAPQVRLQQLLGVPTPTYRHHLLLLEANAERKLAKFHGAVGGDEIRSAYTPEALIGQLAGWVGLGDGSPCTAESLIAGFAWSRVRHDDLALRWAGAALEVVS